MSSFSVLGQGSFSSMVAAGYGSSDNNDLYYINGSYFLSPLDSSEGPLGESIFLNRSNALRAGLSRSESDFQDNSFSSNFWNLGGTYHLNNTGLFINININININIDVAMSTRVLGVPLRVIRWVQAVI